MSQPAIFLDRDGTLVHPRHYPSQPSDLILYDGIGPYLKRLQGAGFRLIIITNQAGIARGYLTKMDLQRMHNHLRRELARVSVHIDGIYYCPHHVQGIVPELSMPCACRKPGSGMLLQAATDLDIALANSWFVGDILDDVEAGNRVRCRTVLVDLGTESPSERVSRQPSYLARDTRHALAIIEYVEGLGPVSDLRYLPAAWNRKVYAS